MVRFLIEKLVPGFGDKVLWHHILKDWADRMAQLVKVLVTKPDNSILIPRSHMVWWKEN